MAIEQSASERKARQLAEASREKRWRRPSFLKEVFLGRFRPELLDLDQAPAERPEFLDFVNRLAAFLRDEVDSAAIDATGEVPPGVVRGLAKLGAFGIGQRTVDGHFAFLEDWGLGLGLDADDLRPVRVSDPQPRGARTSAA
jgi:hypothetical protein